MRQALLLLLLQPEHSPRCGKTLQLKFTDWHKSRRRLLSKFMGGQDRPMQWTGQCFDARGKVHRLTDTCEFQAIPTADVSVGGLAQMERHTKLHTAHALIFGTAGVFTMVLQAA